MPLYPDCAETLVALLRLGRSPKDGVYQIKPAAHAAFSVYCHGMGGGKPKEYLNLTYVSQNRDMTANYAT